ncbi:MAG TPA: energy-coupling factor transporter transmembrane component T, partial [Nitrososphaerales archaeon]|nr:energy-coupling factor transporter transmembrane component T [Nitrososphaerales archaeon]
FRDVRVIAVPFVFALLMYLSARIPFKEVKGTWRFIILLIVIIGGINGIFLFAFPGPGSHVIAQYWIFTVTVEGISGAAAATLKLLSVATATLTMVFTTDPSLYGPSLAKLGVPYKGAYVFDLAMRYLPAYANDLETTLNAQMARGYRTKGGKNVLATIINTVPLIVPVSINAMLSVYEVADAMELRGFGAKKQRTWFRTVGFGRLDYAVIGLTAVFFVAFIYLRILFPSIWVP